MPLHPLVVHLPIGLLIGNALLTILYLWRGNSEIERAAYHCLWLGLLLGLPTIAAGVWDAVQYLVRVEQYPNALVWINGHAIAGAVVALVYWQAWQIRRRNPTVLDDTMRRRGYLAWVSAGVIFLFVSGWTGGHMVYELGIGPRP